MSSVVPEGWKLSPLGDIASVNWGNTSLTKNNYTEIGFPAFSAAGNDGLVSNAEHISTGVVLSAIGARCGRTFLTPQKWTAIKNTITILTDDQDIRFLYQVFNFDEVWNKSGGAQPFISLGDARKTLILHPPLPEQKKIASILTSVDEVIENTQKQIDKLQDLKKATMNELLTNGIGHTEFKDSELGRIPKSWEVMRMRSIAQVIDSLHETPTFSDSGIPMVRVTDIKRGDLSVDNAKTVSEEDYRKFIKKYEPQLGDIVMSRVGSYGVSSYVSSDKPFCMGQNTVIINPVDISGRFLYECLESDCIQRQIELEVAGSGYKSLSLADIRALAIPVPPMHEQERIRCLLLSIDGQVIVQKQKLTQTQSLKKSLMQDLLTGKVRVMVN